jgi:signal transduction histidine kinase
MSDAQEPRGGSASEDGRLRLVQGAMTEFVSHLSRDIRAPLTLILSPLHDILESPAPALAPGSRTVLEAARRRAMALLQMVDAIAAAGDSAGGTGHPRPAGDLASRTVEIVEYFRPFCDAAGVQLIAECAPVAGRIAADNAVWETVLINLLAGAVTATLAGAVEVRLSMDGGTARLSVSDTGAGIPEADLPYVFERLNRTVPAASELAGSSGFGLPFVRDLVRRHGGSIDVSSTVGRGTTFVVTFPAIAPATDTAAAPQPVRTAPARARRRSEHVAPDADARGRGHVVIVEDHPETRAYLTESLKAAGFTVDDVPDGLAALAVCIDRAPDVVVSDVLMPGLGGFDLIARLRADERTAVIPVLLLSARSGEDSRIEGIAAGADDYLVKPLSSRELVARVDGAVRLGRLRRDVARREQADLDALLAMASRLVEVQEAERRQLSTELHDRTSPQLAAIQINLKMLGHLLRDRESEDIAALLDDTVHLIGETTAGIRDISSDLRPAVLDDGGLLPALAAYTQQFSQRTGIQVALDTSDSPVTPPPAAVQSSLFRIVQEALTNCVKHAQATSVTIRLGAGSGGELTLFIADDGIGFDLDEQSTTGLGLLTMKERAEFLGGHFAIESRRGHGTQIMVRL